MVDAIMNHAWVIVDERSRIDASYCALLDTGLGIVT